MIGDLWDSMIDIDVPVAFLYDRSIRYGTKVVCMAIQCGLKQGFDKEKLVSSAFLAKQLGKKKTTITRALKQLQASSWPVDEPFALDGVETVKVPNLLILDKKLTNSAKVLFCLILTLRIGPDGVREARFSEMHKLFGLGFCTVKRGIVALRARHWLLTYQKNKHAPIKLKIDFPFRQPLEEFSAIMDEVEKVGAMEGTSKGEKVLLATLKVLVDSDYYDDHYSPKFLINPDTGRPMHYDRFYHHQGVAIEFNGPQHYRVTAWFDAETVTAQKRRDSNKRQLSDYSRVTQIVFIREDLTLERILEKIQEHLPLRLVTETIKGYLNNRLRSFLSRCRIPTKLRPTAGAAAG
ncbi:MAG: hypothetical protein ACOX44_11585 [Limnochordia bacterium]